MIVTMKLVIVLAILLILTTTPSSGQKDIDLGPLVDTLTSVMDDVMDSVKELNQNLHHLERQTISQQFAMEENMRVAGNSGINIAAGTAKKGKYNYNSVTHIGEAAMAIHDHANIDSTLGMGEVSVVMNGVNFRTRHNDYKLVMPATNSTTYAKTEPIPFPDVPPSVTGTLEEQILEMREWFKAFQTQNRTHRDYTEYFKAVFCYMEGAWTLSKELEEPFHSERHHLEAKTWQELLEKIRFAAYSGTKNSRENWAYLPTKIMEMNRTTGNPVYAQWNYRILCHPIRKDVAFSTLIPMSDLTFQVGRGRTAQQVIRSRGQRFTLYDKTMSGANQLLDTIFYDIPGLDNVMGKPCQHLTFFNGPLYRSTASGTLLNTCRYHRQYKYYKKGAMGVSTYPRGFNDQNLWVAQTNQPKVAAMGNKYCMQSDKRGRGGSRVLVCKRIYNRFSYAIPLEIVYLTPLLSWNPYNFTIHPTRGKAAANGRNGYDKPFDGIDDIHYYMTPAAFYPNGNVDNQASLADTSNGVAKVLDQEGVVRHVRASGTPIFLHKIPGSGIIRLRYPIFPVYGEGSSVWKELNALKHLIGRKKENGPPDTVEFMMSVTVKDPPGEHIHEFTVSYGRFQELIKGKAIPVLTEPAQQHTHQLRIEFNKNKKIFYYTKCDTNPICWDSHPKMVYITSNNEFTKF